MGGVGGGQQYSVLDLSTLGVISRSDSVRTCGRFRLVFFF